MWYPVGADIQTRFTVDATIDGLAPDLVVVAQGDVTRTAGGVHIERDFLDIDLPLVAMRGLERAEAHGVEFRSEEHTSELQSLMRISYAVFCLKKKKNTDIIPKKHMTKYKRYIANTRIINNTNKHNIHRKI